MPLPTVEIEVGGQQFVCEYEYSKGTPDVHTLPNGDPGYPGDPEEFALTKISLMTAPQVFWAPPQLLDVTDLIAELSGLDLFEERAYEQLERDGAFDEPTQEDYDRDD